LANVENWLGRSAVSSSARRRPRPSLVKEAARNSCRLRSARRLRRQGRRRRLRPPSQRHRTRQVLDGVGCGHYLHRHRPRRHPAGINWDATLELARPSRSRSSPRVASPPWTISAA
jgi:hypothetical protein